MGVVALMAEETGRLQVVEVSRYSTDRTYDDSDVSQRSLRADARTSHDADAGAPLGLELRLRLCLTWSVSMRYSTVQL